jgi:Putative esterase
VLTAASTGLNLDATEEAWSRIYNMYSYITAELPKLLQAEMPEIKSGKAGIFGHTMEGHRALIRAKTLTSKQTCNIYKVNITQTVLYSMYSCSLVLESRNFDACDCG